MPSQEIEQAFGNVRDSLPPALRNAPNQSRSSRSAAQRYQCQIVERVHGQDWLGQTGKNIFDLFRVRNSLLAASFLCGPALLQILDLAAVLALRTRNLIKHGVPAAANSRRNA